MTVDEAAFVRIADAEHQQLTHGSRSWIDRRRLGGRSCSGLRVGHGWTEPLAHVLEAAVALDALFDVHIHLRHQQVGEFFFHALEVARLFLFRLGRYQVEFSTEFFDQAFSLADREFFGNDLVGSGNLRHALQRQKRARMAHVEVAGHEVDPGPLDRRLSGESAVFGLIHDDGPGGGVVATHMDHRLAMSALMLAVLLAPLLTGWVNQCRAWLQNRGAPSQRTAAVVGLDDDPCDREHEQDPGDEPEDVPHRAREPEAQACAQATGRPGVLHGTYSMLLQDEEGLVQETHSISAGLDYPGVGPEHSFLKDTGRAHYAGITDAERLAIKAWFEAGAKTE